MKIAMTAWKEVRVEETDPTAEKKVLAMLKSIVSCLMLVFLLSSLRNFWKEKKLEREKGKQQMTKKMMKKTKEKKKQQEKIVYWIQ